MAERKFVGIELNPEHFAVACRRIEDAQRQSRMFA
jgi:DNA modification methylase